MEKKESPEAGRQAGNGNTHKGNKRNRTKRYELVTKWIPPVEVLTLEGGPR